MRVRGGRIVALRFYKAAASQGTARKVRAARARTGSALDGVMAWIEERGVD